LVFYNYFENSVNARISGTPSEIARRDKLVATPNWSTPEASATKKPARIIDNAHTTSKLFLRVIFMVKALYHELSQTVQMFILQILCYNSTQVL
jgi:hypothetical protein